MTSNDKKQTKTPKVVIYIGAWLSVIILGVISLLSSLLLASAFIPDFNQEGAGQRFIVIFGVLGIQALLLLIFALWKHRNKIFTKQLLIGVWTGVAIYVLILGGGVLAYVSHNVTKFSPDGFCSSLNDQYQSLTNAIVPIATDKGTGTGFAVKDGHTVVTAYHVVEDAQSIKINFLDDERPATIVDSAPEYDLAVLHIDKPMEMSMHLTGSYQVTDQLYALGYPGNAFEAGQASLSGGILSRILTNEDIKLNASDAPDGLEMVQTDMALNPGNSGGPIINKCGVVAVVSMKSNTQELAGVSSEEGINYGISAKTVAKRFNFPLFTP